MERELRSIGEGIAGGGIGGREGGGSTVGSDLVDEATEVLSLTTARNWDDSPAKAGKKVALQEDGAPLEG